MLASLIAGFASGEVMNAVRRAKSAAIAYLLAFAFALVGIGFLIAALFTWVARHFGTIEAAIGFGVAFFLIAIVILLLHSISLTLACTAHSPSRRGPRHGGRRGGRVGSARAPEKSGRPRRAARGACRLCDLSREPQAPPSGDKQRPSTVRSRRAALLHLRGRPSLASQADGDRRSQTAEPCKLP